MPQSSSPPPDLPPISGNPSISPPPAANNNASPPSPGSNSSPPSEDPKAPPPSSSTPSEPTPSSNESYSPPPNRSRPAPPPNIAALPPSTTPSYTPSSPPPSVSSPPPSISPPDSKAAPPLQVVIPPTPKSPQGAPPPPPPLPRGPPSPSTPNTSPPGEIVSAKPSPSTPSDAEQVNIPPPPKAPPSSHSPPPPPPSPSGISSGTGTAIGISAAVLAVALVAMIFFVVSRKQKKKKKRGTNGFSGPYKPTFGGYYPTPIDRGGHAAAACNDIYRASNSPSPTAGMPRGTYMGHAYHAGPPDPAGSRSWYTYEELTQVTDGFSHSNIVGEGGFGCVYKGYLPDGRQVAVKQLKFGSGQGEREFGAEVEIISRIHHRHLVSLVGYCIAEQQRLLVYEFIPNKTLEFHLHEKKLPVLDWPKRMKIAVGSARGLAYLHEDCHPRIIHRDIKSANILVDDSFEAKVADFGLAKLSNDTNTHVSTRVMGTFGYMAPEYASSGKLTDRSDVFSFGVVLLELITGRKPVDPSQPLGDESLVEWARPLLVHALEAGDYEELVDPRLENNFVKSEMLKMIEAAAACVRHSANKRPRMVQVLRALDSEGNLLDLSNGVKFGQSTVYDSGQYSDEIEKFRKMAFESGIYNS